SVGRLRDKLRATFRRGRGRALARTVADLTPILRGWANYFRLAQVKGTFEDLDGWIRRKLRCILWRQWKRPYTRVKPLKQRGPYISGAVRSVRGHELVLRLGREIAGVVALAQLARRLAAHAVDHAAALHGWPLEQHVGPALDVLVILHAQELGRAVLPAFREP